METLKQIAKRIPFVSSLHRALMRYTTSTEDVFTKIYRSNAWGGDESVSGRGSDADQTETVSQLLPGLFEEFNISTMLDIPCGDFHWMKGVDLSGVDYIGADIVEELVQKNNRIYSGDRMRFQRLNLVEDNLPRVDMVFCRDCLVHLSNADVSSALDNICRSGSEYLLTTTFTREDDNGDIAAGQWRVLNLQRAPFNLPKPHKVIIEGCTVDGDAYEDKALGVWKISDIRESAARQVA